MPVRLTVVVPERGEFEGTLKPFTQLRLFPFKTTVLAVARLTNPFTIQLSARVKVKLPERVSFPVNVLPLEVIVDVEFITKVPAPVIVPARVTLPEAVIVFERVSVFV